ncbi:M3 family oligoendopeptidase [Paradevosia shaoguanensis]|uniref:M3 family oligoendopeptidase n=1 Tax=Paradevosia shaoguanensis TaxID=1335043 RepID=A0AA41QQR1_9HYPH|nr:M3 family oligoendopeptidase [Paradevosia shaoguanensis]MCF1744477.1 M3 family oligoendopeptidase [Paradevosia shaoguanensis]MCI0128960.1 M3 family oligoendopeptidase [Paradevosia shaoguanensis]
MTDLPRATEATSQKGHNEFGAMPEWNLDDLYPGRDSLELKTDLEKARREAESFEAAYKGKLDGLARNGGLVEAVKRSEALDDLTGRIGSFAYLQYAQNTQDPNRAKFLGDMNEALTSLSTRLIFFGLELNRIEDDVLEAAFAKDAELARYRPWFAELRKSKPYQLEDRVEELFHDKSVTAFSAWNRLFDETMASLKFEVDDETLGLEATLHLLSDKDEKKREAAFHALSKTLHANERLFTHITNVLAKDKEISDRWRGFGDIADSRHLANSVEREVVDALEKAVREAYPRLSHRYYKMKAKWFGKSKLNAWDRNAPLPSADDRIFDWETAKDTVLEAYGKFSPKLAEVAAPFFENGWIDAPVKDGKAPGAFAHPTVPSAHPYLMLNYLGRARDVMTLAHELGHGVHQRLAAPQGALMAPTPLTLAETASVFGEMLTFRSLLAATTDPKHRFALLSSKVEDMLNTVVRQIAFYTFERKVHTARRDGELRTEEIDEMWLDVSRESLGEGIELNEGYDIFWAYIPHFIHSPFYVYAYAFGDCLVNSLYAQYEKSSEGFAERYFELLKAGGSKHHSELLAPFGLDARDPKFWSLGLSMIERLIDELEATDPD